MRDDSFLTMIVGTVGLIFISVCLVIDHGYTVYKITACKNKAIEYKMPYLEINEVCK